MSFNRVAVLGAGTMGSGIAGQVANAGVEVLLLDLPGDETSPNGPAEHGLERISDPQQPGLMSKEAGRRIRTGNLRDDFALLAECDWVAEAVVERLEVKRDLYRRLHDTCGPDTIITSNTSTIPIRLLVEDMPESFRRRFAITHFFNPVRFMRLLELVSGEDSDPVIIERLDRFCEQRLGKGVVRCRDTPGFLGNRVGVFAIQCALHTAFDMGIAPGRADAVFGRPMGIPKTGVFGLYDLIGIDLMADVVASLVSILPADDAFHRFAGEIPLVTEMIRAGRTGNKSGQGFYRQDEAGGERMVMDLAGGGYVPYQRPAALEADLQALLADDGEMGRYAWTVLSHTLCYAASLIPEVGDDPLDIDDAMKLGYNWIHGPFELMDAIGVDALLARLEAEGREAPEFLRAARGSGFYRVRDNALRTRQGNGQWRAVQRPEGVVRFNEKRRTLSAENGNAAASWFMVDEVAVVEFHSKANTLDGDSMAVLADAVAQVGPRGLKGLLVHNDAAHFSCGVNLGAVRDFYRRDDLDGLDRFLDHFQKTVLAMRDADCPVVAAPVGLSLGGGFEVVLHARRVICHANSVMGLVESLVGVVPSGGGCKETLYRWVEAGDATDVSAAAWKAFMNIGYGRTATSPAQAAKLCMLRANDGFEMNRDRMFQAGIQAVRDGAGQAAFHRPQLAMPGRGVFQEMCKWLKDKHAEGVLTPHDVVVGTEIARIVSGGEIEPGTAWSEQDLLDAERRAFLALVSCDATRQRIDYMLDHGGPLRN